MPVYISNFNYAIRASSPEKTYPLTVSKNYYRWTKDGEILGNSYVVMDSEQYIVVKPNETIICHTNQYIHSENAICDIIPIMEIFNVDYSNELQKRFKNTKLGLKIHNPSSFPALIKVQSEIVYIKADCGFVNMPTPQIRNLEANWDYKTILPNYTEASEADEDKLIENLVNSSNEVRIKFLLKFLTKLDESDNNRLYKFIDTYYSTAVNLYTVAKHFIPPELIGIADTILHLSQDYKNHFDTQKLEKPFWVTGPPGPYGPTGLEGPIGSYGPTGPIGPTTDNDDESDDGIVESTDNDDESDDSIVESTDDDDDEKKESPPPDDEEKKESPEPEEKPNSSTSTTDLVNMLINQFMKPVQEMPTFDWDVINQ